MAEFDAAAVMKAEAHRIMGHGKLPWEQIARINYLSGQGDPEAQNYKGLFCQAIGKFQDASQWYSAAISAKPPNAAAALNLGSLTRYGLGVEKNVDRAVVLYTLAGDYGQHPGYLEAGMLLFEQGKFDQALGSFQKAMKVPGHIASHAKCMAADILGQGLGEVMPDPVRALALIDEAVAEGYPFAMAKKGSLLLSVANSPDHHEGLVLLAEAARKNVPTAMDALRVGQSQLKYNCQRREEVPRYVN